MSNNINQLLEINETREKGLTCQELIKTGEKDQLVLLQDPLADYRIAEKREFQLQTFYETKIANYKEKELREEQDQKVYENKPQNSTKKVLSEDQLIFKMISKLYQDNYKEQTEVKYQESKNQAVQYFLEEEQKHKARAPSERL